MPDSSLPRVPLLPSARRSASRLALGTLLLLCATHYAHAQYLWIDEKGIKQLSDRPPPPNVPPQRILKAPGKVSFNPDAPAIEEPAPPVRNSATLAERNADYQRRQQEAGSAASQAATEARQRAEIAANCDLARKNQQTFKDGIRIASYDKNGERRFLSDAERAEQEKNNSKVLASCK
jgi:hypothetical protein